MKQEIQRLVDLTTIVQVRNKSTNKVEFGNENITSRYHNHRESQIDIDTLIEFWKKKWTSFGNEWNEEKQLYKHLFDTFQLFYYSFKQLKQNKSASIPLNPYDDKLDLYVKFSAANLFGIYNYGKKCIDLVERLKIIQALNDTEIKFLKKFKETRNKIFEHNYDPKGFNMTTAPTIWSIAHTNSLLDVSIHGVRENEYGAKIDYCDDYYELENILTMIISDF